MKMTLSIYRVGSALVLKLGIRTRKAFLPKLLIPVPQIWHIRLDR
jgi:hypothetical protein